MEEDITKNLIRKSGMTTSEDFTDKLLLKIESEKTVHPLLGYRYTRMRHYAIFGIIGVGAGLFTLIYFGFLPEFNVFDFQFKINRIPLLIITTWLLLLGANHILKMQHSANLHGKS
ncbi:hypothetical protein ED312_09710 [Sinomicrobium pectinilyticum]|uniref:Uncharacterized protein n=1 Tax=Sinomicrobium pectinilyticum TaxID=1084421 RepID=A0A3N0EJ27_SINP1|nr:hypothetical protein [Sinomicrobium pectinilyticum]RNL87890.1 hypothetical protein ED312_09710 [Sinomicrobium pectinilyticum]